MKKLSLIIIIAWACFTSSFAGATTVDSIVKKCHNVWDVYKEVTFQLTYVEDARVFTNDCDYILKKGIGNCTHYAKVMYTVLVKMGYKPTIYGVYEQDNQIGHMFVVVEEKGTIIRICNNEYVELESTDIEYIAGSYYSNWRIVYEYNDVRFWPVKTVKRDWNKKYNEVHDEELHGLDRVEEMAKQLSRKE